MPTSDAHDVPADAAVPPDAATAHAAGSADTARPGPVSSAAVPETAPSHAVPSPRRHLLRTLVLLALSVLVVDQATKAWVLAVLRPGARHPVLGDLLGVQLVFNPGAALSIATGMTWVLTLVAVAVVVVVVRVARRLGSTGWAVALGLLLGGALGNLGDRLVRAPGVGRGHVVDFIAYGNFFVGNVADIAIVAAAVLVVLLAMLGVRLDGTRETSQDGAGSVGPSSGAAAPTQTSSTQAGSAQPGPVGAVGLPDAAALMDAPVRSDGAGLTDGLPDGPADGQPRDGARDDG